MRLLVRYELNRTEVSLVVEEQLLLIFVNYTSRAIEFSNETNVVRRGARPLTRHSVSRPEIPGTCSALQRPPHELAFDVDRIYLQRQVFDDLIKTSRNLRRVSAALRNVQSIDEFSHENTSKYVSWVSELGTFWQLFNSSAQYTFSRDNIARLHVIKYANISIKRNL